jgi:hypothetical protein
MRLQEAGRLWTGGQKDQGRASYLAVWRDAVDAVDDYHACAAAHMLGAIAPEGSEDQLHWHEEALQRADRVSAHRAGGGGPVSGWYPSLYLSLGNTQRLLGRREEALASCERALALAEVFDDSDYARDIRAGIERALAELRSTS